MRILYSNWKSFRIEILAENSQQLESSAIIKDINDPLPPSCSQTNEKHNPELLPFKPGTIKIGKYEKCRPGNIVILIFGHKKADLGWMVER